MDRERHQQVITVGILSAPEVEFELLADAEVCGSPVGKGRYRASARDGKIEFEGSLFDRLRFSFPAPKGDDAPFSPPCFTLNDVVIGVDFHWQRREKQTFPGDLLLLCTEGGITAVNVVGVEDYLRSVISSEMKSSASPEFLKAHSVISRSWLLAQIERREHGMRPASAPHADSASQVVEAAGISADSASVDGLASAPAASGFTAGETIIKWFDREDHTLFDVCADDHCQRYQGLSRMIQEKVDEVISQTWGEVLIYEGALCDARFSKCCGGMMERFDTCWENRDLPYLQPLPDAEGHSADNPPFCSLADAKILSRVLNDYDLETDDFYRWSVTYSRKELSELVCRRSGIDFGEITALVPIERGPSGRISLLQIVGTRRKMAVGKELLIRKWLSETHLKSSAFDVEVSDDGFTLSGRGWGHGVGLCQIGAAVMGEKGYNYRDILSHYFPGSHIETV